MLKLPLCRNANYCKNISLKTFNNITYKAKKLPDEVNNFRASILFILKLKEDRKAGGFQSRIKETLRRHQIRFFRALTPQATVDSTINVTMLLLKRLFSKLNIKN